MRKALLATAMATALAAPQAFAQADNFVGFSLGANVNLASSSTEYKAGTGFKKMGDTTQIASLEGGYGFSLGGNGVLGLGLSFNLGSLKAGEADAIDFKGKEMHSVYIAPGYTFANVALFYAKLAYVGMRGQWSDGGMTATEKFDGIGYGAGGRALLTRNLYLQVELMQSSYNEKTIASVGALKPLGTMGTIGLGYKF